MVIRSKENVDELDLKIPFVIHPTLLLGKDRDRNLYFFFSDDPTAIYIQLYN